ncbi:MAG: glycosyltransferase family 2 protein [Patescibacteria group bacterium]|nr:glycosyltransferase family 2 protein [Patescibacteria group bacterium]
MSQKIKLSVALATFNEERCLAESLESVKALADEVVIVDGSSTDKTVEIGKKYGAKVIVTDNKPIFHINKQMAIDECRGEWILLLDADEVITPELTKEIKELLNQDTDQLFDAYFIKRRKMFLGKWIKKGGQYPDPVIRLFKKGKAFLPCKSVHEQMEVKGRIGSLNNSMVHLPTPSFTVYLIKDNRYSSLTAKELWEQKVPINFYNFLNYVLVKPFMTFFSLYFRHRGFKDGFPGFVFAFYSGLHLMTAYVKYWEMKENAMVNIEKDWQ